MKTDYIVTKDGENVVVKYKKCIGLDEYGESPEFANDYTVLTYTAAEEPAELDAFAGTWVCNTNSSLKFVFDGKGIVTVVGANEGKYAYTVEGNKSTHYNTAYAETITCTLTSETAMTVNDQYGEWLGGVSFTKQAEEAETLDAFAGTWVKGSQKYIFDGKGFVKNEDGNISTSYTINAAGKAVFSANGVDFICTIKGDKLEVEFDDGEYQGTNTFTKQA